MNVFRDPTSGIISEGTGLVTGLRSCGPRRVMEVVNRRNWTLVVEAAQNARAVESAKKPIPSSPTFREIPLSVSDKASCVCAIETDTVRGPSIPINVRAPVATRIRAPFKLAVVNTRSSGDGDAGVGRVS